MRNIEIFWVVIFCLFLGLATNLYGWDEHFRLTEEACRRLELPDKKVKYIPLKWALQRGVKGIKARSPQKLRIELKLNKNWRFKNRLRERPKRLISVRSILSTYSDEPDWGPDQDLFEKGQYPELWTKDTKYVAQRKGLGSQGFRHMYFSGKFNWKDPMSSLQVPMRALGQAPERAKIFYELSQSFFEAKAPYWGYRFLAWALHYAQDMLQPFHVRQIPYLSYIRFQWKGWLPELNIEASSEQIAYYHLSYEWWIAERLRKNEEILLSALAEQSPLKPIEGDLDEYILRRLMPFSSSFASIIGKKATRAFAPFNPEPGQKASKFVGTEEWQKGIHPGFETEQLKEVTAGLFRRLGVMTRNLIVTAQPPQKKKY